MFGTKLFYDIIDYVYQTRLCWDNTLSPMSLCHTVSHVTSDHLIVKDMSHEHREIMTPPRKGSAYL